MDCLFELVYSEEGKRSITLLGEARGLKNLQLLQITVRNIVAAPVWNCIELDAV
jgi:hypothetical protein